VLQAVVVFNSTQTQNSISSFIAIRVLTIFHEIKEVLEARGEKALSLFAVEVASDEFYSSRLHYGWKKHG